MPEKTTILNAQAIHRVLTRIAHEIVERNDNAQSIVVVGVQSLYGEEFKTDIQVDEGESEEEEERERKRG